MHPGITIDHHPENGEFPFALTIDGTIKLSYPSREKVEAKLADPEFAAAVETFLREKRAADAARLEQ